MYEIEFYYDKNGESDIVDMLDNLKEKALTSKTDRIFFFYWKNNRFVLLHHYVKKSQKTPQKELKKAKHNLKDFLERNDNK